MESRKAIEGLEKELRHLMQADAAWCATRLAGARARLKRGQPVDRILAKVAERARQSSAQRAQRAQALPGPSYDGQLPIHGHREEIIAAIREHPVLILAGETGPKRDIVVLNAAAALWVTEVADSLEAGLAQAAESLDSGRAQAKLDALVRATTQAGAAREGVA